MDRKKFIKKGLIGLGSIVTPKVLGSCSEDENIDTNLIDDDCDLTPRETAGPFPIISPADLVRQNIIGNRSGIALVVTITVQDRSNNCNPYEGVFVDIWHCDALGNYSQYDSQQTSDFTGDDFLRGRQTTDINGEVSFTSIFPGWYPGRAPHIHVEVLDENENSLLITQFAFPENITEIVYATSDYNGDADTSNERDFLFTNSLDGNMIDSISGNTTDGYTLQKTVVV